VLTTSEFRDRIEAEVASRRFENIQFVYFDLPWCVDWLARRHAMGVHAHYFLWQYLAPQFVKGHPACGKVDVVHHVTLIQFVHPGFWDKLGKRYVLGPLGGTETVPREFDRLLTISERVQESLRRLMKAYFISSRGLRRYLGGAERVLFAHQSMADRVALPNVSIMLDTPVNPDTVKPRKDDIAPDVLRVIWVGVLNYRKAAILLLMAMRQLRSHGIRADLYGDGPKRAACQQFIRRHQLGGCVALKGRVPREALLGLYSTYDVFVFTSLRETTGTVTLEAMAAGLPIVYVDHQGVRDVMAGAEAGIGIDPRDPQYVVDRLAEALLFYKNNPATIQTHGANARKRLSERFTWEQRTRELADLYAGVAAKVNQQG
jgi:glycosyltransferase involved in cell wall biosynthesis